MSEYWLWWIAAALLVGLELTLGTFYLLAVGVAFVLGGVAAWLGASGPVQLTVGGVLAVLLVIVAHQWRSRRGVPAPSPSLDVGQQVKVDKWNPDGTARVVYRGTQWNAELAPGVSYRAETMYIVDTRGSTLVVSDQRP